MKKRVDRQPASKSGGPRTKNKSADAAVARDPIRDQLAGKTDAQSIDDLVAGLGLRRLDQQQTMIRELVAMTRDGELTIDRRGRYRLAAAGPDAGRKGGRKAAISPRSTGGDDARASGGGKPASGSDKAVSKRDTGTTAAVSPALDKWVDVKPGAVVEGIVSVRGNGYGFVVLPPAQRAAGDVFLPSREMDGVLDGDRLRVRVTAVDDRGRLEGRRLEIVEPGRKQLVGRLHVDGDVALLVPSDPHQSELVIAQGGHGKARQGQVVVAEILRSADRRATPTARVVEVLGDHLEAGMEIEAAIREHGLPYVFSKAALGEAKSCGETVPKGMSKARRDLRTLPLVTIDGADARDFDDAVCARSVRGGGWRLWVAIADVSAYVTPGSALDDEARERGTSVYFPERVVPMLPEALSNGLCSLNPQVDRLCMVCEMRIDAAGETQGARFYAAVIRSHARLIYDQVAALLEDPQASQLAQRQPDLVEPLQALDGVYAALLAARSRRGAIDFESTETRIVFDANRKIEAIRPVQRTRAHRLIEECMIAANVEAAKFVGQHEVPAPFRVHAAPDVQKVAQLREFLKLRGVSLGGGAVPEPGDYARAVAVLQDRPDAGLVQTMMLRSLMQARYAAADDGHFGLALDHYTHFTSPIRRYPDLLLHRAIKHILARRKISTASCSAEEMGVLCDHCSSVERRADEATRGVITWLKCEYMSHRVGERFDGIVTGVTSFGVFVELEGLYVDGMVHISRLGQDYFDHDASRQRIVGRRNGAVFALGTRLRVQVVRVGLDDRKIDLEPVTNGRPRHRRG